MSCNALTSLRFICCNIVFICILLFYTYLKSMIKYIISYHWLNVFSSGTQFIANSYTYFSTVIKVCIGTEITDWLTFFMKHYTISRFICFTVSTYFLWLLRICIVIYLFGFSNYLRFDRTHQNASVMWP